ncbi:MAG: UDP-N-acetylglucosamine 2-epimerase (hydrolyzing) [Candidatus Nitronauta litoralis]|uniref:UDP-N-acetylglucosamine 2-epimerase (Hydrolyzing) n=1 Tax=Candidatus Nitronauta litoralis TaxID=2705533 RepID=A0A7T0FZD6_9BACT|nr:MAG: UDP-N-acetylglucosamine 2-epimerase (hydrolyzing) [Candidatus Nitronauta litoralis]
MRKILYVSGTRADFGLLSSTLKLAHQDPGLEISVCVTGMHLAPGYGNTVNEIEESGLRICDRIPVLLEDTSGASMARALADELAGMIPVFEKERPDLVLLLGDRGEMLAGALAAIHLNLPVVHIHGGERSGTVDEPVRHAISKLAHYHFAATENSQKRLIQMGEAEENIFITGAPGLDGLKSLAQKSREQLCSELNFDSNVPLALVLFHPVLAEEAAAGDQITCLMDTLQMCKTQSVALMPNSDAGGNRIRSALEKYRGKEGVNLQVHLPRIDFVSLMKNADIMVGNSSSGIIEAATFGTPVVNVGQRQQHRERNANVIDVPVEPTAIANAVRQAFTRGRFPEKNIYGNGDAGTRIVDLLKTLPITPELLNKTNAY